MLAVRSQNFFTGQLRDGHFRTNMKADGISKEEEIEIRCAIENTQWEIVVGHWHCCLSVCQSVTRQQTAAVEAHVHRLLSRNNKAN